MSRGRKKNETITDGAAPALVQAPELPAHLQKYWKYVEKFDISDKSKVELIHTVLKIVGAFVDQAFGEHPVQVCLAEREGDRSRAGIVAIDSPESGGLARGSHADRSKKGRTE